jgi:glucose-1-phosphate thymidylyltransferase
MRAAIMAAGQGTRLWPLTSVTNKHLLPVFDKPMIYYPLTTLILAGATDILLICNAVDLEKYRKLLGDGSRFGINLDFTIQKESRGIAEAFTLQPDFFRNSSKNALILGDNLLYGSGLGASLNNLGNLSGATIFGYEVADPSNYGVVEIDSRLKIQSLEEKPKKPKSKYAVPGLYFYDESVIDRARELKPSSRGELEITDLNNSYLKDGKLNVIILERGTAWLDTGSIEDLVNASEFVKVIEHRQGLKIGVPEEASWRQGLITSAELRENLTEYPESNYKKYLLDLTN